MGKRRDQLNYLRKLTPARFWNGIQVVSSYYWSRAVGKPVQWGLPLSVAVEPTTACNLGCPECPSGLRQFTRATGNLKQDRFKDILKQLAPRTSYMTFYFQGEPYINPDFLTMVKAAHDKKIYTSTSTNAHFLSKAAALRTVESGLDRLIISIDGTTQEVYEQYRVNGSLEKVLAGTRAIIEAKKELKSATPHVIFQFLVVKPNEHQIADVEKLGAEMGVDEVRFKTAQMYDYENGNPLIPTLDEYSRYRLEKDGRYTVKNKLVNRCWRLWSSCVITWDGLVVPCCFDKDASHKLGDLKEESFTEIWQNEGYKHFRKALLKGRDQIDICTNCSEGTKVWA